MLRRPIWVLLVVLAALRLGVWWALPTKEIPTLIVDKTVPDPSVREHALVSWLLAHHKITTGGAIPTATQHVGTYSDGKWERLTATDLEGKQLLYLADGYGIYHTDFSAKTYEASLPEQIIPVALVHGGYSSEEADLVEGFVARGGTVVAEFNLFGYPTRATDAGRRLEALFGVRYTGWLGRSYRTLEDVPKWMKVLNEEYTGRPWTHKSPGIVLFREGVMENSWYPEILVLTKSHVKWPWLEIQSSGRGLTASASRKVQYEYWFEINEALDPDSVEAWFDLGALPEALEMLGKRSIPARFPAAVAKRREDNSLMTVYFAGDFADQPFTGAFYQVWLAPVGYRIMSYLPGMPWGTPFAWRWYAPVMQNIFLDVGARGKSIGPR